jgi:K(+)-stimulated pyrophosphate-energized sodium pump
MTMSAVDEVTSDVLGEIRRQLREVGGLLEARPGSGTARCVDIATITTFRKMAIPGTVALALPWVVGFGLSAPALAGMLGGTLLGSILLAFTMCNAAAAWSNARQRVEEGHYGGKGSAAHAAVTAGDALGDPFRNVSGPAMSVLLNLTAITSLVIAPVL